jgi:hypothetical protein
VIPGKHDRLAAVTDTELFINPCQLVTHRLFTYEQDLSDLHIGQAMNELAQNLALPLRKTFENTVLVKRILTDNHLTGLTI